MLIPVSCNTKHGDIRKNPEAPRAGETDSYTLVYNYAAYLSGTKSISAEEAIPFISDIISLGYYTEARYCIDNLKRNGIHSFDLLALRGLCLQHELQPELALRDLEAALRGDPGNEKIRILMNNLKREFSGLEEPDPNASFFQKGVSFIEQQNYDSALYYMNKASKKEDNPEYDIYRERLEQITEGDRMILSTPGNYKAYIFKSQGLAALRLFSEAQSTLDKGLNACPENLNLILAKALVWVQQGQRETAELYLFEQEQQGIVIDPAVKQKILQPQN